MSCKLRLTGTLALPFADVAKERKMAASVAIGLLNRVAKKPVAVALNTPNDWKWIAGIRSSSELSQKRWVAASDADIMAFAVATGQSLLESLFIQICSSQQTVIMITAVELS